MSVQNFILWTGLLVLVSHDVWASDVQVVLKVPASATSRSSIYDVTSGEIDGQATVTRVNSESEGLTTVDAEIYGIKSTFSSRNAPYGGHITATIECHAKKYVKEKNIPFGNEKSEVILAVASSRRIFGICTADEIKFASGTWAAFDKAKNRVLSVQLFKPVADSKEIKKAQDEILKIVNEVITQL